MQISYKTKQLKATCEHYGKALKKYGPEMARKIHLRIKQIAAASSVQELVIYRIGRCHLLHGNREGQYAMDLAHPYRLVFVERSKQTAEVIVINIEDYH